MLWACVYPLHLAIDGDRRTRSGADQAGPGRLTHTPADETRWLELLAAWAYRYSSEVALLDDAIVLEISRSRGLFGPWHRLLTRLSADLSDLGFRHAVAAAPTATAARVLAEADNGRIVDTPVELEQALQAVRLEQLSTRIPDDADQHLAGMGVRTLGQLLSLPYAGLNRRFGQGLTRWLDRLTGRQSEALCRYRPPDRFEQRLEFDEPITHLDAIAFPLRRMIGDLACYLAGRDGGVQRFELALEHERAATTTVHIGLRSAERDADVLFDLAREYLVRQTLPAAVGALRLNARELPPFVPASRDLFDARPEQADAFECLCERLRARLGEGAVYFLGATIDPRPEYAQTSNPDHSLPPGSRPRPTWLLARPIPLRGPPPDIIAGPERLETGWWDGGDIRRDYYRVETNLGQHAWVFCPPGEVGCWMLHGWFA